MNTSIRVIRALVAATIIAAVLATLVDTAMRVPINPFNFFGYFTIQSNLIIATVYAITAARSPRGSTGWLALARACATSYLVVVGIVYALLLAPLGAAGGVQLPWTNFVMHVLVPVYAAIDWLFVGDRAPLSYRRLWVAAVYPLVWCAVVLARGATDGWVPYPFLDPATGYASVLLYVVVIAVVVLAVAALVFWASRGRGLLLSTSRLAR